MLLKLRGRMWIDKTTYQWARVEAETTDTISWGLFLARLNSGAHMSFEQTEVNSELWLPKRLLLTGSGRIGLVNKDRSGRGNRMDQLWEVFSRFQDRDGTAAVEELRALPPGYRAVYRAHDK